MAPSRTSAAVLALVTGLGLAACSATGDPPERRTAQGAVQHAAPAHRDGSAGCRRPAATTGRHTFGGRSYLLTVPEKPGPAPAPLLVDLHGLRSNGFQQALYGRLGNAGPARGFIVAEPEGGAGREGWKLPGMPDGEADVAYVGRLLGHLERTLCVDRRREFAAGFSNGAGLAAALLCGLPGRLAGIAPVAGVNLARPCAAARPATIVAFHGSADPIVPFGGGEPFGGDRARVPAWMRPIRGSFALPQVRDVMDGWARTFGCGPAASTAAAAGVTRVARAGCRGGARVELYTVSGGGHTWPGSLPIGLGGTTSRIDATALMLDAFARA